MTLQECVNRIHNMNDAIGLYAENGNIVSVIFAAPTDATADDLQEWINLFLSTRLYPTYKPHQNFDIVYGYLLAQDDPTSLRFRWFSEDFPAYVVKNSEDR